MAALGEPVSTTVPLLSKAQVEALPARAREVVEYRKSGLSLNHIQGCPLDCAGLSPHRAAYDVLATARLFLHLASRGGTGFMQLEELPGDKPGYHSDAPSLF